MSSESSRPSAEADRVCLLHEPLSLDAVVAAVASPAAGAISTFIGTTRDNFDGRPVVRLEYEAYEPMALKEMAALCSAVRERWEGITAIAIYHRLGVVPVMESSVIIAVSSPHRAASLEAVSFAINELKARVPVWKKEFYGDDGDALDEAAAAWKENKEFAKLKAKLEGEGGEEAGEGASE
eukprot:PLAT4202.1.p1 GENE.PLAT4202.1~~PLAT4202.1.p1  ORF type:complete len:181 (-),score=64.21 PLAT4202.1:48-590(-)